MRAARGTQRRCWQTSLVACALLAAPNALGNGRFPAAGLVAFDPEGSDHLALSTTFGVLETTDGGESFSWICESVLDVADGEDPSLAVVEDGTTLVGTLMGMTTRAAGACSWSKPAELAGERIGDLSTSRSAPSTVYGFTSRPVGAGAFESRLVRTDDNGASWQLLEPLLPDDILPITLDIAPSDAERLYLTASLGNATDFASALLVSSDGGQSFEMSVVPGSSENRRAFIAAVHPSDADRLYLRIDDPAGTQILLSADAGQTFETLFEGTGPLLGFALSPDGSRAALGGPSDGLWVGTSAGEDFERRSDVGPTCLGWSPAGLFACADSVLTGFSVGRSDDEGASFESLLRFSDLCGVSGCDADSELVQACQPAWQQTGTSLNATCGIMNTEDEPDAGTVRPIDAPDEPAPRARSGCSVATLPGRGNLQLGCSALLALVLLGSRRLSQRRSL